MLILKKLTKPKNKYPAGTRVQLVSMDDDIGTIHVGWDCGSSLGLVYGVDQFRKIM